MSLFSFFSKRSLTLIKSAKSKKRLRCLLQFIIFMSLVFSAIWLGLLVWYHMGKRSPLTWVSLMALMTLVMALIKRPQPASPPLLPWKPKTYCNRLYHNRPLLISLYMGNLGIGLLYFIALLPKANRMWQDEVANILSYRREVNNPNLVTLYNVRNFNWQDSLGDISNENFAATNSNHTNINHNGDAAVPHWQTRQVDLTQLAGMDIVNSYWMGPQIGHTLVSFRFNNDRPLAFSFEIRKRQGESFSTLAGFFRKYELSLIAAEERDIIYTRSNYRGEQVYLFPLADLAQAQVQALFEQYLHYADTLQRKPHWYNTLTQNCTNLIFRLGRKVDNNKFALDYRIWLSGYVPNYLYDNMALPDKVNWDIQTWYKKAHINPKTSGFSKRDNQSVDAYSKLIREGLPITNALP